MCGIVGSLVFNNSHFSVTESYINRMRDTMIHRGPDGAGTWISNNGKLGLGHRRLSIIDLSDSAGQPMCNHDKSIWVTFNGEIYNHAEIRRELIKSGYTDWKTSHSDTEVILYAYQCWGIECLHRFRGMFAFALWDERKQALWLVRDRIGVKPLYYSMHHGRLTFASEIKALLADPGQQRDVDEQALYHYLGFLCSPVSQTLFSGINKVPAGYYIRVTVAGNVEKTRYWDPWQFVVPETTRDDTVIAEKVLNILRDSVRYRKVSDVPVGVFLSGGIDSSTNTALFSEGEERPVNTFSIGYDGEYQSYKNELEYARLMAAEVKANHRERILSLQDILDFLPDMARYQDEPLADPVCIPVYYVSRLARESGMVVCQVGEGADELFWGYPAWRTALNLQRILDLGIPRVLDKAALAVMRFNHRSSTRYYEWMRRAAEGQRIFWGGAEGFTDAQKRMLFGSRLGKKFEHYTSWQAIEPLWNEFQDSAWEKSVLHWMSFLDLKQRLPELLLMRVDKMSMATSLECRVPFLDHKFVEYVLGIPQNIKTRNGELKYILKKAVKGVIPDVLINRPKQGFGVPVHEYLYDRLGHDIATGLTELCSKTDYFNKDYIAQLQRDRNSVALWTLYNFYLWWKEYLR